MSDQQECATKNEDDIEPVSPDKEEEAFGIVVKKPGSKTPVKAIINRNGDFIDSGERKDLGGKDLRAFKITKICIYLVVFVWLLDFFFSKMFDSKQTDAVVDLLKYVITASLSFFFGTSVKKSSDDG